MNVSKVKNLYLHYLKTSVLNNEKIYGNGLTALSLTQSAKQTKVSEKYFHEKYFFIFI